MDPATAFVFASLMMLANGWVLGMVGRDFPAALRPCTASWRIATLLLAGGALIYAVRDYAPRAAGMLLANGLLLLGCTGYWRALRQFYGRADAWWIWLPAGLGFAGVAWFAVLRPDTLLRVFVLSSCFTVLLLAAFVLLISQKSPEGVRSRRVMASLFALMVVFTVGRAAYFLSQGISPSLEMAGEGGWINLASPMVAALLPVVGTTAFLLMCSERIGRQWELAASTDYLTGLPNRRTLLTVGERRFGAAQPPARRLALAVIDIDHFKSINDSHGHEVGDVALRHLAEHLRAACRDGDLAARHGGEEFVVLWEGLDTAAARTAGERLCAQVASEPLRTEGALIPMTISMGVAAAGEADRSFHDLLRRADHALYAAKAGGRNRVVEAREKS